MSQFRWLYSLGLAINIRTQFRHTSNIREGMTAARKRDDQASHERGKFVNTRKGQKVRKR